MAKVAKVKTEKVKPKRKSVARGVPLGRPFELTIEEHKELKLRKAKGQTAEELALYFDKRLHTIYDYLKRLLPDEHRAFANAAKTLSDRELGDKFGLTPKWVDWHKKTPVRTT